MDSTHFTTTDEETGNIILKIQQNKEKKMRKSSIRNSITYFVSCFLIGANYFDVNVFPNGNGLDTPLGHPSLDFVNEDPQIQHPQNPFGFYNFPSAQDVSDIVFNINNTDGGNNGRVPHLFMTFGQLMDHDFAYVLHPSGSSSGCKARYLTTLIKYCLTDYFVLHFPIIGEKTIWILKIRNLSTTNM